MEKKNKRFRSPTLILKKSESLKTINNNGSLRCFRNPFHLFDKFVFQECKFIKEGQIEIIVLDILNYLHDVIIGRILKSVILNTHLNSLVTDFFIDIIGNMKFPNQKTRKLFQIILDREAQMKTELRELENQIEQFETTYFQKHWNQGNVVLGWPRVAAPPPPNNAPKIKLIAKDKPFSLSSATSRVNFDLDDIADKNLTPYPENRFQTTKKRKGKKGKSVVETRKRLIRRRRR